MNNNKGVICRWIATMFLALAMVFNMPGIAVFAEGGNSDNNLQEEKVSIEEKQVQKEETNVEGESKTVRTGLKNAKAVWEPTTIAELTTALSSAQVNDTLDLSNLMITGTETVKVPVSLTFDGKGVSITGLTVIIEDGATLTLNNITLTGNINTNIGAEATIKGSGKEGRLIINANAAVIGCGRESTNFFVAGSAVAKLREVTVAGRIQGGSYQNMVGGSAVKNCYQLNVKAGGKVLGGDSYSDDAATSAAVTRVNKVSCVEGIIKGGSDMTVDQDAGAGSAIREVLQAEIQDSIISCGAGDYQTNVIYIRKSKNIYTSYPDDVTVTVPKLVLSSTDIIGLDAVQVSNSDAAVYVVVDAGLITAEENAPVIMLDHSKIIAGDAELKYASGGILCKTFDSISSKVYLKNDSSVSGGSTTYPDDTRGGGVGGVGISGARVYTEGTTVISGGSALTGGNAITGTADGFSELNAGCTVIGGNGTKKNGGHAVEANGMDLKVNGAVLQPGGPGSGDSSTGGSAVYGVGVLTMTGGILKANSYYTTWIASLYMSGGTIELADGYLSVCIMTATGGLIQSSPDVQVSNGKIGKRTHEGTEYLAINGGYVGYIAESDDGLWSMPKWQDGYSARSVTIIRDRTNITGSLADAVVTSANARDNKVESGSVLCLDGEIVTIDFGRTFHPDDGLVFRARNWDKTGGPWEELPMEYTDLGNGKIQFTQPARSLEIELGRPNVTVTFDSQGGSSVDILKYVPKGSLIQEPDVPVFDDYKFEGWFKETECINPWNFASDSVNSNITLYAKWAVWPEKKKNQIFGIISGDIHVKGDTVTFNAIGGGMDNTNPEEGDMRWLPKSWSVNPSGVFDPDGPFTVSFDTTNMKAGQHILTVKFEQQIYKDDEWVGTWEEDAKQMPFVLKEKETPGGSQDDNNVSEDGSQDDNDVSESDPSKSVNTGDTSIPAVIPISGAFLALTVMAILFKKRKYNKDRN